MSQEKKFIVDFMLGRLCRWLRLLGVDALYYRDRDKGGIVYRSLKERRIILTRDRSINRQRTLDIYVVESDNYIEQLREVINRFNIEITSGKIYTRCSLCNNRLRPVSKKMVCSRVPDYVFQTCRDFAVCDLCQKFYWKGTHRQLIENIIEELKNEDNGN